MISYIFKALVMHKLNVSWIFNYTVFDVSFAISGISSTYFDLSQNRCNKKMHPNGA